MYHGIFTYSPPASSTRCIYIHTHTAGNVIKIKYDISGRRRINNERFSSPRSMAPPASYDQPPYFLESRVVCIREARVERYFFSRGRDVARARAVLWAVSTAPCGNAMMRPDFLLESIYNIS